MKKAEQVARQIVEPKLRESLEIECGSAYVAMNLLAIHYNINDDLDKIYDNC